MKYDTIQYSTIQRNTAQHDTIQHNTTHYTTLQYSTSQNVSSYKIPRARSFPQEVGGSSHIASALLRSQITAHLCPAGPLGLRIFL